MSATWRARLFLLPLLMIGAGTAAAQSGPLPASDADLARLAAAGARLIEIADACRSGACPQVDCPLTGDVADALTRTRWLLDDMEPWVDEARTLAVTHYRNQMANLIRSSERRGTLEYALAWQQALTDFGRLLLDLASLADWVTSADRSLSVATGPDARWADMLAALDRADGTFEAIATTVGATDTLAKQLVDGGAGIPPGLQRTLDLKNIASEMKNLLANAHVARTLAANAIAAGDDVARAAAQQATLKSLRSLGQVIGRVGLLVADAQRAEMMDEVRELIGVEAGEALAAQAAFLGWQRWAVRTDALIEARDALGDPVGALAACLAQCPMRPQPEPPAGNFTGYGAALGFYNAEIESAVAALEGLIRRFAVARATEPVLALERRYYHPGDRVTAYVRVPRCLADAGLVRMTTAEGAELMSVSTAGLLESYADFTAAEPGDYVVALMGGGGASLAAVDFTVGDPNQPLPDPGELAPLVPYPAPADEAAPPPSTAPEKSTATKDLPEACAVIDCDCENVEFGLLTGAFQDECRADEQKLIQDCIATGTITRGCHPTASGPNPYPP